MKLDTLKKFGVPLTSVAAIAVALSFLWHVPYIYTLIGLSAWGFVGQIVTIDDDLPGGWSNPDGKTPFPWLQLLSMGAVFAAFCAIALAFPAARSFGGSL